MDRHQAGQRKITTDEAKAALLANTPSPIDVLFYDPKAIVSRHPRESVAVAAALGVALATSPKIRKVLLDGALSIAKVMLR